MSAEVEQTLKRIQSHRGVKGRSPGVRGMKRARDFVAAPQSFFCLGPDARARARLSLACPRARRYRIRDGQRSLSCRRPSAGVLIVSAQGVPIRSNLEDEDTNTYAALLSQLAMKASSVVRTLDETDELTFFRIRSKKHEIMIAPDPEYLLIVIQKSGE